MPRRKKNKRGLKPVRVPSSLHSALKEMQREFKKNIGEEPSLGDLVEKAFEEDPVLEEVLENNEVQEKSESVWDEEFMRL